MASVEGVRVFPTVGESVRKNPTLRIEFDCSKQRLITQETGLRDKVKKILKSMFFEKTTCLGTSSDDPEDVS